jgi:hypothetical protein
MKTGKSTSETLALLTMAYDEYGMKKSSVLAWYMLLKEGREVQELGSQTRKGQEIVRYELISRLCWILYIVPYIFKTHDTQTTV